MPAGKRYEMSRKAAQVSWDDVWQWAEDIYRGYGWQAQVKVSQPLSSQKQVMAVVAVELKQIRAGAPNRDSTKLVWKNARYGGKSVEATALELLVEFDAKLERDAWAAERAAVEAGALL